MPAHLSSLPPPASRPGLHRVVCSAPVTPFGVSEERARLAELERLAPEELKLLGMARYRLLKSYERIGLGTIADRSGLETSRGKVYGKTTVQYWLDARAEERCPPAEFVQWLEKQITKHVSQPQGVRCA